jgi:hypothetical protein
MINQITSCFDKLERMESILKERAKNKKLAE